MKLPVTLFAAALVAFSTPLFAQAPKAEGRRFDCSQAKDPKSCEERRDRMKAMRDKAESACQGKQGAEHGQCMAHEMCAQTKDPQACEEHMSKMKENFRSAREQAMKTCQGKQGTERDQCLVRAVLDSWPQRPLRGLAQRVSGLPDDPLFSRPLDALGHHG